MPVLGSIAQLTHPEAQTNFFASRCVHCESATAASGFTSIVAGNGAKSCGRIELDRYDGSDFMMGSSRRSVKLIWHSTVYITDKCPVTVLGPDHISEIIQRVVNWIAYPS